MIYLFSFKYISLINGFGVRINLKTYIIMSRNGCNEIYEVISWTTGECKAYMT
jgi:hypothetical protein